MSKKEVYALNNIIDLNNSQCAGFLSIGESISQSEYDQYIIEREGKCPYCLSPDCHDLNCVPLASGSSLDKYNISGEKSRMASSLAVFGSVPERKKCISGGGKIKSLTKKSRLTVNDAGCVRYFSQIEYVTERETDVIRLSRPGLLGIRPPQLSVVERSNKPSSIAVLSASASRRKGQVKRTINANLKRRGNKIGFMTLTFEPVFGGFKWLDMLQNPLFGSFGMLNFLGIERKYSMNELNLFIKRLKYNCGANFTRYIWVKEYQKVSSRPHFHIIFFDWKYIEQRRLQDIWGNGWLWINKIYHVKRVGSYVAKYLGKGRANEKYDRLWGCSQNCLRCVKQYVPFHRFVSGRCYNRYTFYINSVTGKRFSISKMSFWNGKGLSYNPPRK